MTQFFLNHEVISLQRCPKDFTDSTLELYIPRYSYFKTRENDNNMNQNDNIW